MRVLLVEDEKRLTELLRSGLGEEGFAVDVAHNGNEGLWMATENRCDAIVLHVMLPMLNGYNVGRRLREAGNWTPILMLTAKDGEYAEAGALDMGADDFVSKPFSYKERRRARRKVEGRVPARRSDTPSRRAAAGGHGVGHRAGPSLLSAPAGRPVRPRRNGRGRIPFR
ncbi:response regulator [Streptosporangium sp. NPDC002544]|uniref:response regulator n=1 Tax=Streptosporangium sp. NPDC002544 TaxID=3154538 RepID=UPI00332E3A43